MSAGASWEETIRAIVAEELARVEERRSSGGAVAAVPTDDDGKDVVNADEAAEFLGLDRKTVYSYARKGTIPHQRLGRRMLFSKRALVSWLSACRSAPRRNGS